MNMHSETSDYINKIQRKVNWRWYDMAMLLVPLLLIDIVFYSDSDLFHYSVNVNGKNIQLVTAKLVGVLAWNGIILFRVIEMLLGNPRDRLLLEMYNDINKLKGGT